MAPAPPVPKNMRRVRLLRNVILNRKDEEKGSIHDVATHIAMNLVGEGSAEFYAAEGEAPPKAPTTVNRMETPTHRDPESIPVAPAPAKGKPAK